MPIGAACGGVADARGHVEGMMQEVRVRVEGVELDFERQAAWRNRWRRLPGGMGLMGCETAITKEATVSGCCKG